ncbi:MAG: hypothetical protein LBE07_11015 [Gordonia sp. (in: high G+C Gram-positive bacteria)]|jgi:hypothetical protein|nr:hypothetical protein [Gordonia sp. (in: high G+C Gram-positive bacteria)]
MNAHNSGSAQTLPSNRRIHLGIAAAAVAVLVACLLIVRFSAGGGGPVDSPSGLSASGDGAVAKLAWTGVSGADSYQVIRDETTVVYTGSDTSFVDKTATEGKHAYTVVAGADDVVSAPSASSDATVGPSWGEYSPLVALLPKVLPQTPDATGWNEVQCGWLLSAFDGEVGPTELGSGKIFGRARMSCHSSAVALGVAWLDSKDATDSVFSAASAKPGAQAIRWRFGTGYFDDANHAVYLRPDNVDNIWIGIGTTTGTKDQLLAFANDLPLE